MLPACTWLLLPAAIPLAHRIQACFARAPWGLLLLLCFPARHLTPASSAERAPRPPLPALQSYGRTQEKNADCLTYVASEPGCGFSLPSLVGVSSPTTKWTFDPVPGGSIYRWYIRMSVRAPASMPLG